MIDLIVIPGELAFLVAGLYFINHIKVRFPNVASAWTDGTIPVALGMLLFHFGIWLINPDFWISWSHQRGFALFQLLIGIGLQIFNTKKEEEVGGKTVAVQRKEAMVIGLAVAIVGIVGSAFNTREAYADRRELAVDGDNKANIQEFWHGQSDLTKKQQEQMIGFAAEVGYQQYEPDGVTPLRSRLEGFVCVMQLEEERLAPWAQVLKEEHPEKSYDMSTLEGCLNMALWVRTHFGATAWSPDEEIRKKAIRKPLIIVAPPPSENASSNDWSEKIPTPSWVHLDPQGVIRIRPDDDDSRIMDSYPNAHFSLSAQWVEVQSRKMKDEKKVPVDVIVIQKD